jgi:hypothetical protein
MVSPRRAISIILIAQHCRTGFIHLMAGLSCVMGLASIAIAAESSAESASRVSAHLTAGEFGPALNAAASVADPEQRAALVQSVANAQQAAGEPVTAAATLKRISRAAKPVTGGGSLTGQAGFGGGGSTANFMPLMQIIQQNTSGKWNAQDAEGGAMSQKNKTACWRRWEFRPAR